MVGNKLQKQYENEIFNLNDPLEAYNTNLGCTALDLKSNN